MRPRPSDRDIVARYIICNTILFIRATISKVTLIISQNYKILVDVKVSRVTNLLQGRQTHYQVVR